MLRALQSLKRNFGKILKSTPAPEPEPEAAKVLKVVDGRVSMPESVETFQELSFLKENLPVAQARLDRMKRASELAGLDGESVDKDDRDGHVVLREQKFEAHDGSWSDRLTSSGGQVSDSAVSLNYTPDEHWGRSERLDTPDQWMIADGEYHLHSPKESKAKEYYSFLGDVRADQYVLEPDGKIAPLQVVTKEAKRIEHLMNQFSQWQNAVGRLDNKDERDLNKSEGSVLATGLSRAEIQGLGVGLDSNFTNELHGPVDVRTGKYFHGRPLKRPASFEERVSKDFAIQGSEESFLIMNNGLEDGSFAKGTATQSGFQFEISYHKELTQVTERVDVSKKDGKVTYQSRGRGFYD